MLMWLTFLGATAAVAITTVLIVRKMKQSGNAVDDFFIGGRALAWPVIAGSLLLTNLSTEQLVGLNGAVFGDGNLVGIAWEVMAAFAMIAMALIFLPRYLASGFTTTPAFLEKRYGVSTRRIVAGLFLLGYVTVLLPVVLYTGSFAVKTMFATELARVDLWMIVVAIGGVGSCYAIFGGLKSVAVSDTINGIGLLVGGIAVPVLALAALGDGSIGDGLSTMLNEKPKSLAGLATEKPYAAGEEVSVPWPTLLTGMMFIQIFYWSTNQVIVQRAMGAKSLSEGQKGVLFASALKIIGPVMLCVPGIIALHMTDQLTIEKNDGVYGAVVRHVLPNWSIGLFLAVLIGSILSSFNSALNSASTIFCVDFYGPMLEKSDSEKSQRHIVTVGQIFATVLAVLAMVIAPQLERMGSIFEYLQKANGLYSVPIIAIFFIGIISKRAPAIGANIAMAVGILTYGIAQFVILPNEDLKANYPILDLHWLHWYFICLMMAIGTLIAFSLIAPRSDEEIASERESKASPVDMTPWKGAKPAAVMIFIAAVAVYAGLQVLSMREPTGGPTVPAVMDEVTGQLEEAGLTPEGSADTPQ